MPGVVKDATGEQRYIVAYEKDTNGHLTVARTLNQVRNERLPLEKTRTGVLAQLEAHEHIWGAQSSMLARNREDLGNLQFGGAVLGAVGVLAKSLDVGRVGAALAGSGAVWDSHYQLAVQKNNYRQAGEAARCARLKVDAIEPAFFDAYYYQSASKQGMLRFSQTLLTERGIDETGFNRLANVFPTINRNLHDVRDRLQKAQEAVTLATPSSTDLVTALQQKNEESAPNTQRADNLTTQMTQGLVNKLLLNNRTLQPGDVANMSKADLDALQALVQKLLTTRGTSLDDLPLDAPEAQIVAAGVNSATVKKVLDLQTDLATCAALLSK
jgi:hypothetical protein